MTSEQSTPGTDTGQRDLLLQETIHRGSNDLQMIVGLLTLQSRRAISAETQQALADAVERVSVLAQARRDLTSAEPPSLAAALQQVCAALQSQAGPRSILVALKVDSEGGDLSPRQVRTLALVVNELATNAIKHAYQDGKSGYILVTQSFDAAAGVRILVDDDGLPFPDPKQPSRGGLGMVIAERMMRSIGGEFVPPRAGSKVFELRVAAGEAPETIVPSVAATASPDASVGDRLRAILAALDGNGDHAAGAYVSMALDHLEGPEPDTPT